MRIAKQRIAPPPVLRVRRVSSSILSFYRGVSSMTLMTLSIASVAASANVLPTGDKWVSLGLAVEQKDLQVGLPGGEFPADSHLAASQDGRSIAFERVDVDLAANINIRSLWLLSRSAAGHYSALTKLEDAKSAQLDTRFEPQFSPNGDRIAYLANPLPRSERGSAYGPGGASIAVRQLKTGAVSKIETSAIPDNLLYPGFVATGVRHFSWSPDGSQIGMIVTGYLNTPMSTGMEVSASYYPTDGKAAAARLVIYDVSKGQWILVSAADVDVDSFDWAPDGQRMVFAGSTGKQYTLAYMYTRLYIARLNGAGAIQVPSPPGMNVDPRWSPNGRWIVFHSQAGQLRWLATCRLGLYDVRKGTMSFPAFDEIGRLSGYAVKGFDWAPDSKSLMLRLPYHMSDQLFRLSIPAGILTRFTTEDKANFLGAHFTDGGQAIAYMRESFLEPRELYISPVNAFHPQRITNSNSFSLEADIHEVSWPSRDSRWIIHGWLLLPSLRRKDSLLPLLIYAEGGPQMVSASFRAGGWHYPLHSLIANGVAVLIPNSRGRAGYGTTFESAWENERDCGQGPLEDDLAGLDFLIQQRIVDPARVALAGYSWGGFLAAYALTHTNRFRAVLIHEGQVNLIEKSFGIAGDPSLIDFAHQLGEGLAFEDTDAKRLRNLSPVYQAASAATPSLLEYGADSGLQTDGIPFFASLRYFNKAPTELIGYPRTGHVTEEPALRYDAARRDLEWIAYWVLGKPTQRMLDRYGPPNISEWAPEAPARAHLN